MISYMVRMMRSLAGCVTDPLRAGWPRQGTRCAEHPVRSYHERGCGASSSETPSLPPATMRAPLDSLGPLRYSAAGSGTVVILPSHSSDPGHLA